MEKLEEIYERLKGNLPEEKIGSMRKFHDAVLLMGLNMDPRNKFGGEYERLSKEISISDVLYRYLVVVIENDINLEQILRRVLMRVGENKEEGVPEIKVMPPTVRNTDNE